jgi:predicted alpha/beta superfamily hydrolase
MQVPGFPSPAPSSSRHLAWLTYADHEIVICAQPDLPVHQIVYLLDGNAAFDALELGQWEPVPGLAIVTIGYSGADRFDLERRSRDYTPPPPSDWDGGRRRALDRPNGGAASFMTRLTDEILPMVEQHLHAEAPRRVLWGHSYGGLFAFWALMQGVQSFNAIHAASPSLWWGDYMLERQVLAGDVMPGVATRLTLSMGDSEISGTGERLYAPERLELLAATLREKYRIACDVFIFENASHGEAFGVSLKHTLASL